MAALLIPSGPLSGLGWWRDELLGTLARVVGMSDRAIHEQLLDALYRECAPMLNLYARRLTSGDSHRAEEAVQEAFSRAWGNPHVFDPSRGSARAWLVTVVRNILIDESRTPRIRRTDDDSALAEHPAPLDEIDRMLTATLLEDALASLAEPHRLVIVRCYYGGTPLKDLAAELGVPLGTAKSRLFYGLRALRAALQERGLQT